MTGKDVLSRMQTHKPIVSILPPSGFTDADVCEFIQAMNEQAKLHNSVEIEDIKLNFNAKNNKYYITGEVFRVFPNIGGYIDKYRPYDYYPNKFSKFLLNIDEKLHSYVNECNEISKGVFILLEVPSAYDVVQTEIVTLNFNGVRKITWVPIRQNIEATHDIFCPTCGMKNWATRRRCRRCGAPL